MAAWQYDKASYGSGTRTICAATCKDARITAMWMDEVSNVPLYPATDVFPWTVVQQESSAWILGDVRDQHERDRTGPTMDYAPIGREQWHTDYPGDAAREAPQGLSLLAASILAARKATGTAGGY